MERHRFDTIVKDTATGASRRRILAGLGGAALAAVGLLATREEAAAGCRKQCRRRCEGRKPRCQERCEDRRCG